MATAQPAIARLASQLLTDVSEVINVEVPGAGWSRVSELKVEPTGPVMMAIDASDSVAISKPVPEVVRSWPTTRTRPGPIGGLWRNCPRSCTLTCGRYELTIGKCGSLGSLGACTLAS